MPDRNATRAARDHEGDKKSDDVILAVALLLSGIAALVSYVPARRGTRVDPLITIAAEGR